MSFCKNRSNLKWTGVFKGLICNTLHSMLKRYIFSFLRYFFPAFFQRVGCQCYDELLGGNNCENHIPPCNVKTCYENVTCYNNAVDPHHPCGPCPYGYTGDGESCNGKRNHGIISSNKDYLAIRNCMFASQELPPQLSKSLV